MPAWGNAPGTGVRQTWDGRHRGTKPGTNATSETSVTPMVAEGDGNSLSCLGRPIGRILFRPWQLPWVTQSQGHTVIFPWRVVRGPWRWQSVQKGHKGHQGHKGRRQYLFSSDSGSWGVAPGWYGAAPLALKAMVFPLCAFR